MTGPVPVGAACWRRRSRRSRWSLVSPSSFATDARSASISLFLAARLASRSATDFSSSATRAVCVPASRRESASCVRSAETWPRSASACSLQLGGLRGQPARVRALALLGGGLSRACRRQLAIDLGQARLALGQRLLEIRDAPAPGVLALTIGIELAAQLGHGATVGVGLAPPPLQRLARGSSSAERRVSSWPLASRSRCSCPTCARSCDTSALGAAAVSSKLAAGGRPEARRYQFSAWAGSRGRRAPARTACRGSAPRASSPSRRPCDTTSRRRRGRMACPIPARRSRRRRSGPRDSPCSASGSHTFNAVA